MGVVLSFVYDPGRSSGNSPLLLLLRDSTLPALSFL